MGTKNTLWNLYWTVFMCDDNFMHTQGNKIFEDGRKRSSKLFKCFKVISGNRVKFPEDNSISHPLQSLITVCQPSVIQALFPGFYNDSKCIKIDMRCDQISQNPSQSCTLVRHTAWHSFSLSLTHTHPLHPHIQSPREAVLPGPSAGSVLESSPWHLTS